MQANLMLARAFGAPIVWMLGAHNDTRSLNAGFRGVPMIMLDLVVVVASTQNKFQWRWLA